MREKERKKNTKNCKIEEQARALTHFQQAYILHIHAKNTLYNDLLFLIRLILNEIKWGIMIILFYAMCNICFCSSLFRSLYALKPIFFYCLNSCSLCSEIRNLNLIKRRESNECVCVHGEITISRQSQIRAIFLFSIILVELKFLVLIFGVSRTKSNVKHAKGGEIIDIYKVHM